MESLPGVLQCCRLHRRKRGEVQDGLRTGVNIDGKRPVVEVPGCSILGKESGLVVTMARQHRFLKGPVLGGLLVVEQRADVVRGVKTVDPSLPPTLPVIPPAGW